jgi:hypothetical protein
MELQLTRRILIDLSKSGNLAVANDVAAWEAQFRLRILEAEIYLGSTGSTSGNTTVDVKLNGVSIFQSAQSIAQGAATKRIRSAALTPMVGEPNGVFVNIGDYLRVDVTAIPGTTSADLTVTLNCAVVDV